MAKNLDKVKEQRAEIVARIMEDMERDGLEWAKDWQGAAAPYNAASGEPYHGINRLHLSAMAAAKGYGDPRWATFAGGKRLGWKLRRGERACIVEYWKQVSAKSPEGGEGEDADEGGEQVRRPIWRCVGYWNVFNAEQFEGVEPLAADCGPAAADAAGELADALEGSSRCPVDERAGLVPCYVPAADEVRMPPRGEFSTGNEGFCATLLHEMAHSTGHPSALGREQGGGFGSAPYAFEELVAELASVFACADLGLSAQADPESPHYLSHVAYVKSWLRGLEEDPDALFRAAGLAQKAADFVTGRLPGQFRPKRAGGEGSQKGEAA